MEVVGQLKVRVKYGDQEAKLVLVVVGGNGPSLFGRNWLKYLRLDGPRIASVQAVHSQALKSTHAHSQDFPCLRQRHPPVEQTACLMLVRCSLASQPYFPRVRMRV